MLYRNIAIIAHVDHGKTTLLDALLKQGGAFAAHEEVGTCVMDSFDQEKERGITIYAKNTSIKYGDSKINIVDTPGHADFGSEVERALRTVDSVLLLVDAYEGPMPQTKFVLKKALELNLKPIVVINKIDKPTARPDEVLDMVFDLFVALGANEEQLDFSYIYTIARDGVAKRQLEDTSTDLTPLFELILEKVAPAPQHSELPLKMQVSNLDYDNFLGRMAIGRIFEGTIQKGMNVFVRHADGNVRREKITKIFIFQGLKRTEVESAEAGDIVCVAGIPTIYVGETIAEQEDAEPFPEINIDPPTLSMNFLVNDSPFAGKEGKFVTTRHIKERLEKELETNVGLEVELLSGGEAYKVSGRGEMHLAVLIETMRREGFELQISRPEVIMREQNGTKEEPMEFTIIDLPEEYGGTIIEKLSMRKGELKNIVTKNGQTRLEFEIPTRGLLGFRGDFLILTRGEGILTHSFSHYAPYKGSIPTRMRGSIISGVTDVSVAYAIWQLQDRGMFFIGSGVPVYEGMVVGESSKEGDMSVNVAKEKKLSNVRASGSDEAIRLTPPVLMTLERALEYIAEDELVEVTPKSVRLRKKYLTEGERKRNKD